MMECGALDVKPMELDSSVPRLSFTESFRPYYVEKLKQVWPDVKSALAEQGISGKLNLAKGYLAVRTTKNTKDPDIIHRARNLILLLAKTGVPPDMAIRVFNGALHHDYIKTGYQEDGLAAIHGIKQERFEKQVKRLKENVKDLAYVVGCSLFINGDSVTPVGISLEHVMAYRIIVKWCILTTVDPARIVKALEQKFSEMRMETNLKALHI